MVERLWKLKTNRPPNFEWSTSPLFFCQMWAHVCWKGPTWDARVLVYMQHLQRLVSKQRGNLVVSSVRSIVSEGLSREKSAANPPDENFQLPSAFGKFWPVSLSLPAGIDPETKQMSLSPSTVSRSLFFNLCFSKSIVLSKQRRDFTTTEAYIISDDFWHLEDPKRCFLPSG